MTTELSNKGTIPHREAGARQRGHRRLAGRPQLTPVWIDLEGDELVFNTAKGRAKDTTSRRTLHVAVSVVDPDDQYNVVVVRGSVEATEEGADAHIDKLAKKYLGVDTYPMRRPDEVRVKYKVHTKTS